MDISDKKQRIYDQFDDGLGGAYERIALFRVIDRWAKRFGLKTILEHNATFICGVPAFNSFLFAKAGYRVTVAVHSRDYRLAEKVWRESGYLPKIRLIRWDDDLDMPFKDNSFDIVWNHLVVEQYCHPDPQPLIREMKRLSRKLVYTSTLNPYGIGCWIHLITHKIKNKLWNHGSFRFMQVKELKRIYEKTGLTPVDSGGVDCPPWIDTGDSQIQGSMTYVKNALGRLWLWSLLDPLLIDHWPIPLFCWLEDNLPHSFKTFNSHHLYIIGKK